VIVQPIVGIQPLIIFGGGHIGRSLSKIATYAGFTVTVVDDRQEYAHPGRFPEGVRTLAKSWSDAFADLEVKPSASIVIVTRGHESDKEVLRHAMRTPAVYRNDWEQQESHRNLCTTSRGRRTLELLKRTHAPIGLEIEPSRQRKLQSALLPSSYKSAGEATVHLPRCPNEWNSGLAKRNSNAPEPAPPWIWL